MLLKLIAVVLSLWTTPVLAQSCGADNPNCVAPTPPPGDNSNRIATTAFVTTAIGGGGGGGASPYIITGGTVARADTNRWVDQGISAPDIGVDCTNVADSTTAIQNYVNAHPNNTHIKFPLNCHWFTTSTITLSDAVGPVFESETFKGSGGVTPIWSWKGSNSSSSSCISNFANCVYLLSFQHVEHPTVRNISFDNNGGNNCPNGYLLFDGNPSGHIGTNGRIIGNSFNNSGCAVPHKEFVAVSISPTATNNQENYDVIDNNLFCSGSAASIYSRVGVTNGTTTVTASNNPFSAGDVGKRIRISFALAIFETTISAFVSSSQVTLAVAVPFTQNPVSIIVGDSNGTGIRIGSSQNTIQHRIIKLQYTNCEYGILTAGGNVQISQPTGGGSDVGILIGGFTAQNTSIDFYASESDVIAIWAESGNVATVSITNSRFSNGSQSSSGHVNMAVSTYFAENLFNFYLPTTSNSVLINKIPVYGTVTNTGTVTGGSGYTNGTYTNVNLFPQSNSPYGVGVRATVVVAGGAVTTVTITTPGQKYQPGDVLSAPNSSIGGTGSGFSVPVTAVDTPVAALNSNPSLTSIGNHYTGGCCGTPPTWTTSGLMYFANNLSVLYPNVPPANFFGNGSTPPTSIGEGIDGVTEPGQHSFGCWNANPTCVQIIAQPGNPGGTGLTVYTANAISASGTVTGIKSVSVLDISTAFIGIRSEPTVNRVSTFQTLFEAGWDVGTSAAFGLSAMYGFRARSPGTIIAGTIANVYGHYCDKQTVTNVTTGYCIYNADIADINFFAGGVTTAPTTVGALPTCNTANKGRRMFVSDGNTANAFRGAVTGGGTNNQWITCDGTSWLQG